ncbi:MAG TPA: ABC transporter ATP-binding protein [Rhodocyclaceae bacterium]|nr:ABC transporter ATP-binding protein [Rhodocyclaceae bacterium]
MGHLTLSGVGKAYKRYPKGWGRLAEWCGLGTQHELRWVLRDVSFAVSAGEAVALVGANGAGKSTLLKIVTGTTRPTTGHLQVGGRIAALLELGMGFHPDFTGRQNVYMAGQLQGIPGELITEKMPEVEAFAEIGDYIDQPVRVYSSGMMVRLAFSVATMLRPEILIVDEALSVGDAYFSHKSFDRIRSFRDQGTTLLFVSHDPTAVKTLCDRAILIENGVAVRDGTPDAVLDYYNAVVAKQEADYRIEQEERLTGQRQTRSGNGAASISSVDLLVGGESTRAAACGEAVSLRVRGECRDAIDDLTVGIAIRDRLGNDVFGTNTFHLGKPGRAIVAGEAFQVDFVFPRLLLGLGTFSASVALHRDDAHIGSNFDWWDRALVFQVVPGALPLGVGVCNLPVDVEWCQNHE